MAMTKTVRMPKKIIEWTRMANPLVPMFPNSTHLILPGNWNKSPGDSRMNRTTAMTTGPQSVIFPFFNLSVSVSLSLRLALGNQDSKRLLRQCCRKGLGKMVFVVWDYAQKDTKLKDEEDKGVKEREAGVIGGGFAPTGTRKENRIKCKWSVKRFENGEGSVPNIINRAQFLRTWAEWRDGPLTVSQISLPFPTSEAKYRCFLAVESLAKIQMFMLLVPELKAVSWRLKWSETQRTIILVKTSRSRSSVAYADSNV
ncbi:hypothetical protein H6P81_012050 [Aristolochia fimbriata]|uniref:Uncharacterized protein n=1 Tax=Aristolochia fimbriata TaxID=158543 RepID=A0AAV7EDY7_ARIFI|nr:hypothetical protein H6P81_012050 [Aristolochia fimbriata]